MEQLIILLVCIVLVYVSFKLAGCLVGIVRLLLTAVIFWLFYMYVVQPWFAVI